MMPEITAYQDLNSRQGLLDRVYHDSSGTRYVFKDTPKIDSRDSRLVRLQAGKPAEEVSLNSAQLLGLKRPVEPLRPERPRTKTSKLVSDILLLPLIVAWAYMRELSPSRRCL